MTNPLTQPLTQRGAMTRALLPAMALACALAATDVQAVEAGGVEYSGSGFLTLAAGKMLGGTQGNVGGYNCPCYVSDYANAAIYDGRSALQWAPDSKLGLQGSASVADQRYSLTVQAVSRGAAHGAADLEWLYLTYKPDNALTFHAGRQRLPLFYYSDAQDIGFALPWTHLPTWLYGWQAVNYDGGSMSYQGYLGDWSAITHVWAGNEHRKNSGYWKVYGNGSQSVTDVNWTNILGGNLTLTRDWFETRVVYMQSHTRDQPVSNSFDFTAQTYSIPPAAAPVAKQMIYGLAMKADYQNWLVYGEVIYINHPGLTYTDYSQILAAGYRHGDWLPMLTWGSYQGGVVNSGVLPGAPSSVKNSQQTWSLSLRYDLTNKSDLKMEYDWTSDHSDPGFTPRYGGSRLLTLAYDMVF
jgi:hypothetical protein